MSEITYEDYLPEVGKHYTPGTRYRNRNGDSEWSYPPPEARLARADYEFYEYQRPALIGKTVEKPPQLTPRQMLAGMALAGLCHDIHSSEHTDTPTKIAVWAVAIADAILERTK